MSNNTTQPLPKFISCKTVYALQIVSIEPKVDGGHRLHFKGGFDPFAVPEGWVHSKGAKVGGFWVQYPDGYVSFNPTLEGYTPAEEWGLPYAQEPKYTVNERGRIVNRESGVPIPDDEALMVFRAKDSFARGAIASYLAVLASEGASAEHLAAVEKRLSDFNDFAIEHADRMRDPN